MTTTTTWTRRLIAGAGTGALLAAGTVALGAGDAAAATPSANASVQVYQGAGTIKVFVNATRTVSADTVTVGDTVTVTTKLTAYGPNGLGQQVKLVELQDYTPDCMEYVAGSGQAVPTNTLGNVDPQAAAEVDTTTIKVEPATAWNLGNGYSSDPEFQTRTLTLTAQYTVNCAAGSVPTGGLDALTIPSSEGNDKDTPGWLSHRTNGFTGLNGEGGAMSPVGVKTLGPTITVNAANPNPNPGTGAGSSEGSLDLGSLLNLGGLLG